MASPRLTIREWWRALTGTPGPAPTPSRQESFDRDMALLLRVTPYPRMDAAFFRMKAGRAGLNVSIIGETLEELGF